MSKIIEEIARERQRQMVSEGWTTKHDDSHTQGEMAMAAACYAAPVDIQAQWQLPSAGNSLDDSQVFAPTEWRDAWPWSEEWRKPKTRRHDLIRAAALIVAEIERLDRTKGA